MPRPTPSQAQHAAVLPWLLVPCADECRAGGSHTGAPAGTPSPARRASSRRGHTTTTHCAAACARLKQRQQQQQQGLQDTVQQWRRFITTYSSVWRCYLQWHMRLHAGLSQCLRAWAANGTLLTGRSGVFIHTQPCLPSCSHRMVWVPLLTLLLMLGK